MSLYRHAFLSLGLLLSVAAATQSACKDGDETPLVTDGLRGEWYLRDVIGGFLVGTAPSYTPADSPERLRFSDSGTLTYERFDTLGRRTSRSEHAYEITDRSQEQLGNGEEITKLTVRYTPSVDDLTLREIWLEDGMLALTRHAIAYDGTSKRFARVSD